MLPPKIEHLVIAGYRAGRRVREIATDLGISVQTLYAVLRRSGVRHRSQIARDKADMLVDACRQGAVLSRAARHLGISERTAARATRKQGISIVRGRPRKDRSFGLADPKFIAAGLHQLPLPVPALSDEEIRKDFERLRKVESRIQNGEIRPKSWAGIRTCVSFFPNRYRATRDSNISAEEAWRDIEELERAVALQIKYGDPTTPDRVLKAITLRCRTPTVFRPAVAKFIYSKYCRPGGRVWDPCAGYGGRLLGAIAAGVDYTGTDVEEETVAGNQALAKKLGVTCQIRHAPAETFDPGSVQLVFTSPPYFNRERYSANVRQSYKKYPDISIWISKFLHPVIERAYSALPGGGHLVFNIADLKTRQGTVPLVAETIRAAVRIGFDHTDTLLMPIGALNRKMPTEPILVFKK